MNKLLAAGFGLALLAAPLAASAQDYHRGGGDHRDTYQTHRGDNHRGWRGNHRNYRSRCVIRNEPVRGRHGRIFYRQVEVCRR